MNRTEVATVPTVIFTAKDGSQRMVPEAKSLARLSERAKVATVIRLPPFVGEFRYLLTWPEAFGRRA